MRETRVAQDQQRYEWRPLLQPYSAISSICRVAKTDSAGPLFAITLPEARHSSNLIRRPSGLGLPSWFYRRRSDARDGWSRSKSLLLDESKASAGMLPPEILGPRAYVMASPTDHAEHRLRTGLALQ